MQSQTTERNKKNAITIKQTPTKRFVRAKRVLKQKQKSLPETRSNKF